MQDRAARMYARVLSQWAMDLFELRRAGLDRPVSRSGSADHVTPSPGRRTGGARWHIGSVGELLTWRPSRNAA